jgi:pyruvate dehydrogenase (quinone)
MPTVAELIVAHLKESGVRRVFGLPGDSLNGFTDALRKDGGIEWLHVRHEEVAAFAAGAAAATTGELAVCATSCGPGNTHLVNGLFDAARNRVPVLAIASHIPSPEIGTQYFQETHPQELFRECSVYCELVSTPKQMPHIIQIAMRTAISRQGVAVLVIPGDVLLASVDEAQAKVTPVRPVATVSRPTDRELAAAAAVLNAKRKVTIFAGAGCAGAHEQLMETARRLQAPVATTLRGREHVEYDSPYDVGLSGLLGYESGYRALESCDALLMVGIDFPYREFLPKHVPVIQIDVRGEQIGRRVGVEHPLVGTAKDTLEALNPLLEEKEAGRHNHLGEMRKHYAHARKELDKLADADHNRTPIHPQYVARQIDELASEDAIFVADVGSLVIWSARYLRMNGRRRLIGSFNHGSMANALPQAIGAQAEWPNRQVVTLSGDGGISMLLGDLITLRQHDLPVKVVVFHNDALAFVELEMMSAGIPTFGTDLDNPDFAEVARAIGIHGARVERPEELGPALRAAFEHDGPALIDVVTQRQELSIPPKVSFDQVKGFSLFAERMVFSGQGDRLVSLARENVRQVGQVR